MEGLTPEKRILDFEQMGFGMFVHFGLYSVLGEGEWAYNINKHDMQTYEKLIDKFDVPTMRHIVATAKSAGCKYITLTTRHHEGFSLYDTKGLSDFDVMHSPTGRDLVAEFVDECKKEGIVPFFYHTTLDWHHPDYKNDFEKYLDYLYKSVELLCTSYGEIGGLWFDGNWDKPDADWKEDELYKMIHRYQPNAMVINNTGLERQGELGSDEIDAVTFERGLPTPIDRTGHKKYVAGEMCETLCDNWGTSNDINFKSVGETIREICKCRKVGANMLLNIGPSADGTVETIQRGIMECIGRWMQVYGKAIHNGRPFITYDDTEDFWLIDAYDKKTAYFFRMDPGFLLGNVNVTPKYNSDTAVSIKNVPHKIESMRWLDSDKDIPFVQDGDNLSADMEGFLYGKSLCVRVAEVKFG